MATETLRDYGTKDEFSATVKRAKQKIEISLEQRLAGNNVTGSIFNLKNNFGWKDKSEVDATLKQFDIKEVYLGDLSDADEGDS
jgi:hypothetical protein